MPSSVTASSHTIHKYDVLADATLSITSKYLNIQQKRAWFELISTKAIKSALVWTPSLNHLWFPAPVYDLLLIAYVIYIFLWECGHRHLSIMIGATCPGTCNHLLHSRGYYSPKEPSAPYRWLLQLIGQTSARVTNKPREQKKKKVAKPARVTSKPREKENKSCKGR